MEIIKKILKTLMGWIGSISPDKLLHFIAGTLIAAFFAIVFPCTANWCIVFAFVAGLAKEIIDQYRYKGWDFLDLAYTVAGGGIIQIFAWL